MNFILVTPQRLRISTVATAEPPVAEHGIENEAHGNGRLDGQFVVIFYRFEGAFIPVQTNMPDFCRGHEIPNAFHHA